MSLVENLRTEQGKILQNNNGQYFFVCSTCHFEFVSLESFITHQKNIHNKLPIALDDYVPESNVSNPRPNPKEEAEVSANSNGPNVNKFAKLKRTILVSPTKKERRTQGGKLKTSTPIKSLRLQAQRQALDSRVDTDERQCKCKNCNSTFSTLLYLNSHEANCQMVPLEDRHHEYYCDICSQGFRGELDMISHRRSVHAFF